MINEKDIYALPAQDVALTDIRTDLSRFQPRKESWSSATVEGILADVSAGAFDRGRFEPVILWQEPGSGLLFVLSGHSRLEAFRRLSASGAYVHGYGFDYIPARILRGSEEEAQRIARTSNPASGIGYADAEPLLREAVRAGDWPRVAELHEGISVGALGSVARPLFKKMLEENTMQAVLGSAKAVQELIRLGIPLDEALAIIKRNAGLNATAWRSVVTTVQQTLPMMHQLGPGLNGLGNPAYAAVAKEAAKVLGPIILEKSLEFAAKKLAEKKGKGGKKQLGAVEVLQENAARTGSADGISFDGNPISFGGYRPKYRILPNYDAFVEAARNRTDYEGDHGLGFVLDKIKAIEKAGRPQVLRLAAHLHTGSLSQDAFNVWHWLKTNIGYSLESDEQLRTPSRSYHLRKAEKIDCDDYAIFAAALLSNMGYKPVFRVVAFNNKPNFQHIYVTVGGHVVDPVLDYYGAHPKHITNSMDVYTLSGVPAVKNGLKRLRTEEALLRNLALAESKGDAAKVRVFRHMLARKRRPEFIPLAGLCHLISDVKMEGSDPVGFVWKKDVSRFTPKEMERVHRAGDAAALGEVEDLLESRDTVLEGLGKLSKEQRSQKIAARQQKRWDKQDARKTARQTGRIEKIKAKNPNRAKKVEKRVAKRNQRVNERREANKGVPGIRRAGRAFARFEPLAATGRGAFIAVVKLNFRGLATNMSWGVLPDDVLRQNGLTDTQIKNVRDAWAKLQTRWADIGGNPGILRDAIKTGYRKKPLFGQGKKGRAKNPKKLSGLAGITASELGAVLNLGAAKGHLRGLSGLGSLGLAPAIAAAIAAAASVIGMIGGLVSQVVKAAGKKDAGEAAMSEGGEPEYPDGDVPPVSEEQLYDEAFPEDGGAEPDYADEGGGEYAADESEETDDSETYGEDTEGDGDDSETYEEEEY